MGVEGEHESAVAVEHAVHPHPCMGGVGGCMGMGIEGEHTAHPHPRMGGEGAHTSGKLNFDLKSS